MYLEKAVSAGTKPLKTNCLSGLKVEDKSLRKKNLTKSAITALKRLVGQIEDHKNPSILIITQHIIL